MENPDLELVNNAIQGDRASYEALVAVWMRRVRAVVHAQLGDRMEADDAVQETFILAYQRLHQLSEARAFGPWLLTIARNCAIGWGRRLSRNRGATLDEVSLSAPAPVEPSNEPPVDRGLATALAGLNAQQREVIHLKYECGMRYDEIAATLEITVPTVEKRLWRARQALLALLPRPE